MIIVTRVCHIPNSESNPFEEHRIQHLFWNFGTVTLINRLGSSTISHVFLSFCIEYTKMEEEEGRSLEMCRFSLVHDNVKLTLQGLQKWRHEQLSPLAAFQETHLCGSFLHTNLSGGWSRPDKLLMPFQKAANGTYNVFGAVEERMIWNINYVCICFKCQRHYFSKQKSIKTTDLYYIDICLLK